MSRIYIETPSNYEMTIRQSYSNLLIQLIFLMFFLGFWYWGILFMTFPDQDVSIIDRLFYIAANDPFLIIFIIVPIIFLVPQIKQLIVKLLTGGSFTINQKREIIDRNGTYLCSFSDIESIRFHPQRGSICLVMRNGNEVQIIDSHIPDTGKEIAEKISALTGKPIKLEKSHPQENELH